MNKEQQRKLLQSLQPQKNKPSSRAPPDYESKYPDGMKNFVNIWLKQGIQGEIQRMCGPNKKLWQENSDMRFIYYYHLIKTFLNTEFQEQSIYKKVKDLPKEDRYLAIDCLGCYLGMNPHNGNVHLLQVVKKFKDLQ